MVFAEYNYLDEWSNQTIDAMVKDENKLTDVEEGEISDTASVEEISAEDFKKQDAKVVKDSQPKEDSKVKGDSRVWTMQDLLKYPMCRGYAQAGLTYLAWSQAVQNKPLNDVFVMEAEHDENSKRSSPSSSAASVNSRDDNRVVIDVSGDEMDVKVEDGELEEGEIDMDSDPMDQTNGEKPEADDDMCEVVLKEDDLEKQKSSIREVLERITVNEAENSFEGVWCSLQSALQTLRKLVLNNNVPVNDSLIQSSFTAVQAFNSAFCSMDKSLKEQNKDTLSRLFSLLRSYVPPLFSPDQMKEIDVMALSLNSLEVALRSKINDEVKQIHVMDGVSKDYDALAGNASQGFTSMNMVPSFGDSFVNNKSNVSLEALKRGPSIIRARAPLLPLLDLHKDHDMDSLPSPTRETTPSVPLNRALVVGNGVINPGFPIRKVVQGIEDTKRHPYDFDALNALSSYQQKFGRSSFTYDRLPSPTPSGESGDGNGDLGGEVSSISSAGNFRPANLPVFGQPVVSSPNMNGPSMQGGSSTSNVVPVNSGPNKTLKAPVRSRDPRLRFNNSDVTALDVDQRPLQVMHNAQKVETTGGLMTSRKQKSFDEPDNGPVMKRQKNGFEFYGVSRDAQTKSGNGGWLEDTDMAQPQSTKPNQVVGIGELDPRKTDNASTSSGPSSANGNLTVGRNDPISLTGSSPIVSLPDLLKDIAVNPTVLLNLLKMGQKQKSGAESQQNSADPGKPAVPSFDLSSVFTPLVSTTSSNSSAILSKPAGTLPIPPQITPLDVSGKIRMKPRDPRRVLHGTNTLQRSGSIGTEKARTSSPPTSASQGSKDNITVQKLDLQAEPEPKPVRKETSQQPDITSQFTKNLLNIADIVSVSQVSSPPIVSQNIPSQLVQTKTDRDVKAGVSSSVDQLNKIGSTSEVGVSGVRSQNNWGDVEHLFEGYDERQKVAIQRERARRLDEQKKMFAARKLCLVLDLDHTLLNSAKFNEVEPAHDEILRKKEEQDREKSHRHLFRFPYMGMWTKLRPGIWNFLEKASKLFELHLYTMGNKLYATEMAKVLDPTGVLFSGRVISKGDDGDPYDSDERVPKTKDLEGVLGMESSVVIVDDSVRVWPHNKLNLIVVERYTYFPCSRRQFGLPGPSLLEIDHDERPEEGTLASCLGVIERLHEKFFSNSSLDDVDVRNILAGEQGKILAGCRVVFSRVFPVGEVNPHLHPLWQSAEQFGAVCTTQIDENVTHVVANSLGTDKVNWALSNGKFVVHPGWVEASALLYRRANEQDFIVK